MTGAELVVVGGGILGAATALHVARAGVDVVLLERGAMFEEASGLSAGGFAIQTTAAEITSDVIASVAAWRALADNLGADVGFARTGGFRVATSHAEAELLRRAMPRLTALGLTMQWHDEASVRRDLAWFGSRVVGASYCAEEGFAIPGLAGAALRSALLRAGARVREHAEVTCLKVEDRGVLVSTAAGDVTAERVLIAGGAWIGNVARMLGVELPVQLKTFMLSETGRVRPMLRQLVTHAQRNLTIKQLPGGACLIGGGWPGLGSLSPIRKDIDGPVLARNLAHAYEVVPGLSEVPIARSWSGLEGSTTDELPLMGALPGYSNVYVLGCVQGGFVLGPRLAPVMAEVILGRRPPPAAFNPQRFSEATITAN